MASGGLVVASNYQGLADSLKKGQLGFLAEASDLKSWVSVLNDVINLEKRKIQMITERTSYIKNNLPLTKYLKKLKNFMSLCSYLYSL